MSIKICIFSSTKFGKKIILIWLLNLGQNIYIKALTALLAIKAFWLMNFKFL